MIQELFPLKIYKTSYPDVSKLQSTLLPLLDSIFEKTKKNNQGSMREEGLCSYNAVRNLHTWPELQPLVKFIEYHYLQYWEKLAYSKEIKPKLIEMWANKYPNGAFIDWHNHSPIAITSSFYLQKDPGGGNILFEHPNELLLKHQPTLGDLEKNIYHSLFTEEIKVSSGDLIMFPGYLKHRTIPNLEKTDRIIIGANIHY
jgi:uncharacterized protein (TIGR02466 family)